jgi:hypothetical protein
LEHSFIRLVYSDVSRAVESHALPRAKNQPYPTDRFTEHMALIEIAINRCMDDFLNRSANELQLPEHVTRSSQLASRTFGETRLFPKVVSNHLSIDKIYPVRRRLTQH